MYNDNLIHEYKTKLRDWFYELQTKCETAPNDQKFLLCICSDDYYHPVRGWKIFVPPFTHITYIQHTKRVFEDCGTGIFEWACYMWDDEDWTRIQDSRDYEKYRDICFDDDLNVKD